MSQNGIICARSWQMIDTLVQCTKIGDLYVLSCFLAGHVFTLRS
jgi:hypothetical protein